MPPRRNVFEAMFDIRPVKEPGVLDLAKIEGLKSKLILRKPAIKPVKADKTTEEKPAPMLAVAEAISEELTPAEPVLTEMISEPESEPFDVAQNRPAAGSAYREPFGPEGLTTEGLVESAELPPSRNRILEEFEKAISEPVDAAAVLASIGAHFGQPSNNRIRRRAIWKQNKEKISQRAKAEKEAVQQNQISSPPPSSRQIEEFWNFKPATEYVWPMAIQGFIRPVPETKLVAGKFEGLAVNQNQSAAAGEIDFWIKKLAKTKTKSKKSSSPGHRITFLTLGALTLVFLVYYSFNLKNDILEHGDNAVAGLEQAKNDLTRFDFSKAAEDFSLANDSFNNAAISLDNLGASFLSSFESLPGLGKIKSANDLVSAGQHISKAGKNLALAFDTLSKTNFFSFFQQTSPQNSAAKQSLVTLLNDFKEVLVFSDKNISRANQLLANIDIASLPADKQELLINFKEKIPDFQEYIGNAIDYSDFLLNVAGEKAPKKYIILLQNNSELRATGGFPGTYAVVTFDLGYLKNVFVDDIYNIDGQIKENIIPPKPLQHITPNFGMRDANWFADFPASARKVEEMYLKDGGGLVDGVLAVTPDVIGRILNIVGPIKMSEYGITVTAENFVSQIQNEVEYGENRAQPKTIVKELQPELFAKLGRQDKDHWSQIFKSLVGAAEEKHILLYFNDPTLEMTARKNGLAGEIKNAPGDYLQIVFSNVKGSKTDAVIKNSFELTGQADDSAISHKLAISRLHTGGESEYGFYNRTNPTYVRVYVPQGSVLESITGHTIVDYRPLIGHSDFGFTKDPDLDRLEQNTSHPFADIDVYEESGKTVFGFWLVLKPQESKTVSLSYRLPGGLMGDEYNLLWQKQSGTGQDKIEFNFEIPEGKKATGISENLQTAGNKIFMSSDLSIDRVISIELK